MVKNKDWIKSKEAKKLNKKLSKQNYSYQENSFISIKKSDIKWYAISILTTGVVIGWLIGTAILLFIILR